MTSTVPFFLLGSPHAGAQELAAVLDRHPALRVTLGFNVPGLLRGVQNAAVQCSQVALLGATAGELARELGPALVYVGERIARELIRAGKQRYGDQHSGYALCIPTLEALFPGAQFVHVVRDGRDVAATQLAEQSTHAALRHANAAPQTYAAAAASWQEHVATARAHAQRLGPARYHELRYEDFLAAPEPTLARLLAFLGLEFDHAMRDALSAALAPQLGAPAGCDSAPLSIRELREFAAFAPAEELLLELGYPATPTQSRAPMAEPARISAEAQREYAAGRVDAARALLQAHVDAGVDHPLVWSDLAVLENHAGRVDQAVRLLVRAVRAPAAPLEAALNLLALPARDESLYALERVFDVEHPELITALYAWLIARGASAAAAEAISIARIRTPRAFAARADIATQAEHGLACRLYALGRTPAAEQRWRALDAAGSALGTSGLGVIEFQQGRKLEAVERFLRVVRDPDVCLEALAFVLASVKCAEVECAAFERALPFAHQDATFADTLAAWLTQQGLDPAAANVVLRQFRLGHTPAEWLSQVGLAKAPGRQPEAAARVARALASVGAAS
jgi:hypothetical protein